MVLIKITDLTAKLGISSRSLRYYEQVGLIQSCRSEHEKYRFFDDDNVERLKQILILRKMQIPIKDILRIYESEDMSVVVETFASRIRAIDEDVDALTELRSVVNEFLQVMTQNGIAKISALPILYEKMADRLDTLEERKAMSYRELSALSDKLAKAPELSIVALSPMRVLSSYLKEGIRSSDPEGFWPWVHTHGLASGEPGAHEKFEFQTGTSDTVILKIDENFDNHSPYVDYRFVGGMFAAASVYLDEDLGERFRTLISDFDENSYYEIDYTHEGELRHPAMLENLLAPDERRELVSLLVPVKKRLANPALFDPPMELAPNTITVEEIEQANPVLWAQDVRMDQLIPISGPHYRVTDEGEAEFIGGIIRAVLNTNVSVKLPFRIDMEFRQSGEGKTGLIVYYGEETGYLMGSAAGNRGFCVNEGNDNEKKVEAIHFHQPVFWDDFNFPGRGAIRTDGPNRLTWIVGGKHLAVIINDEIRYCGIGFPYMSLDLSREACQPIVIGARGNDKILFRSIRVSRSRIFKKTSSRRRRLP